MKISTILTIGIAGIAVGFLSQCAPYPDGGGGSQYLSGYGQRGGQPQIDQAGNNSALVRGYWDGDGVEGEPKIRLNLDQQKAYFYKGNQLVGQSPISSGDETHKTPRGTFKVTEKDIDHVSSLYGVIKDNATGAIVRADADTRKHRAKAGQTFVRAPMLNFLRFNGAIGMHTGHLPGYAASHGCVRLPDNMARHFYQNASLGTPVIVE